jgi:tetratricopeptide (TPR) repeat protein
MSIEGHCGAVTTLEHAAFGDRPDLVITTVPEAPRERWLAAVVLGAQGHYARAAALLDELTRLADDLGALAAATLASHRRQLGGHAAARRLDALGLTKAIGDESRSDVLLGLAADAIGAGRLDEARRLRVRAPRTSWRARVRAGWVSAEIDLSAGRADEARPHAERALEDVGGSTRHRIKSEIVLGATLVDSDPAMARKLVTRARDDATDLCLLSLVWPASLLLAQLDPDEALTHRRCAAMALHGVLRRADPRGRELAERSPWVPSVTGPTG